MPTPLSLLVALAPLFQNAGPSGGEGPLRNDTFQPIATDAEAELARGDRAYARSRGAASNTGRNELIDAFDAWRSALEVSQTGHVVTLGGREEATRNLFPDPDHTHFRRAEGVPYAVLRRLRGVTEDERRKWRGRFQSLALAALQEAHDDEARLARVERDHPLTEGAARAALRLADRAFERGATGDALEWLERAARHVPEQPEFERATTVRREAIASFREARRVRAPAERWRTTEHLALVGSERLTSRSLRNPVAGPLGRTVEPGLAFLDDGSVVIQSAVALFRLGSTHGTSAPGGRIRLDSFRTNDFLGTPIALPYASSSTGGWPLRPATDGRDVVLVVGRAGRSERDVLEGNALVGLRFGSNRIPVIRWVVASEPGEGVPGIPTPRVVPDGPWEFQPGPVIHGGRVFVQARTVPRPGSSADESGSRLHVFAIELATGRALWSRFLAKASDLAPDQGRRFAVVPGLTSPGQPLAIAGGKVFVGTGSGLGFLLDAPDGRVAWSVSCRRRKFKDAGWPGSRPPIVFDAPQGRGILWAPFDSDFLYTLSVDPGRTEERLFLAEPRAIGAAEDLVTGDVEEVIVLGRSGPRRALGTWARDGGRRSSLYFARGESFMGSAIASEERVILATDRSLYLFDRAREMFLVDVQPLAQAGQGAAGGTLGGTVYARGARVFVLGPDMLWLFEAR